MKLAIHVQKKSTVIYDSETFLVNTNIIQILQVLSHLTYEHRSAVEDIYMD